MRVLIRLFVATATALAFAGCSAFEPELGPAATVDGVAIPRDAVDLAVDELSDLALAAAMPGEEDYILAQLAARVLSLLVTAEVVRETAESVGVEITESDRSVAHDRLVELIGDDEELELALVSNGLTRTLFDEVLVAQEAYLAGLRTHLLAGREVEMRLARHIAVTTEAEVEGVLVELADGADFAELAASRSLDLGAEENGGELGWQPRGHFAAGLDDAIWSAPVGELVGPVESEFGFHVVEVLEARSTSAAEMTAEDVDRVVGADLSALIEDTYREVEIQIGAGLGEWDPDLLEIVVGG